MEPVATMQGRRRSAMLGYVLSEVAVLLRRPHVTWVALALFTFAVYFALAPLGRHTVFPEAGLSLMWLPTAFGVGMLARVSRAHQVPVALGIVLAESSADGILFGFPGGAIPLFVAANLGEQFVVAEITRRLKATQLRRARDVLVLCGAALVGVAVGATVGAVAGVVAFDADYVGAWGAWYLGGVTAIVLVTPLVLSVRRPARTNALQVVEFATAVGLVVIASLAIFTNSLENSRLELVAVIVPLLGWLGFRFGLVGVSTATPLIIYIGTVAATQSVGPFAARTETVDGLLTLQFALVLCAVTIYCAASVEEARRLAAADSKRAAQQLRYQATHDQLTGLANRFALLEATHRAFDRSEATPETVAAIYADLDGFKTVNELAGHIDGDKVLSVVGARLANLAEEQGLAARMGGDEFVIFLDRIDEPDRVWQLAKAVGEAIRKPVSSGGHDFVLGASLGVVVARLGADNGSPRSPEELLRRADVALAAAKSQGPNNIEAYVPELDMKVLREARVKEVLVQALATGNLQAWVQPIFDARTHRVVAHELLARINAPECQQFQPAEFIPIAERCGLVVDVGEQVLAQGLTAPLADGRQALALNVSARELAMPGYARSIIRMLQDREFDEDRLIVEVTETAVLDNFGEPIRQLNILRDAGVRVALDDFGTGYSSLTFLRTVPHDIVKIDRQFVVGAVADSSDRQIVRSLVNIAHESGRIAVGEGVETHDQAKILTDVGCDWLQGFLLGSPIPLADPKPESNRGVVPRQSDRPRNPAPQRLPTS